ncbi:unnamed protein product [Boreogadus saida]
MTVDIIQEDEPLSLSKKGSGFCRQPPPTAQLPTHHLGIWKAPAIVTNCAPLALDEDLHSAIAGAVPSIDQTDFTISHRVFCRCTWKTSLC